MEDDFKPLYEDKDENDFSLWDARTVIPEPEPEIDERLIFAEECERLKEEAYNKGYQDGLQKADAEVTALKKELKNWFYLIKEPVSIIDDVLTEEIIQTLYWLCEACIHIELSLNPEKIKAVLDDLKNELPAISGEKKLLMNPLDIQFLRQQLIKPKEKELEAILVEDETLARGDFYLKGEFSDIDGRLKTRLTELLKDYFNNSMET